MKLVYEPFFCLMAAFIDEPHVLDLMGDREMLTAERCEELMKSAEGREGEITKVRVFATTARLRLVDFTLQLRAYALPLHYSFTARTVFAFLGPVSHVSPRH